MCRAEDDGGRRCTDHRQRRATSIGALRPDPAPDRPDVEWATDPASTPRRLYADYPAEVAALVVDTMTAAKQQEAAMTADVLAALPESARMHGLEFRMKSPASLARKLADRVKAAPFAEPERIVEKITDVVRYTAISRPEQVVATATAVVARLSDRGWTIVEAEQSYLDGNQYKGLHMLARHPDGRIAEFQFHTDASQQVKDDTHADYERARDTSVPATERVALIEKMTARWAQVPTPPGLTALSELGGCPVTPKNYAPRKMNLGRDT
ncbi:hypothetical protein M1C57_23695 (plasmid) [Rhodococcus pyridinivorans]|uniref:hypothetical protein n=1 Tax=Rhodococcus pyridinivorans TaxID=103816 RepID=UPI00200B3113|nr:hypothetical protein [Rhodococcus pyridinivorans]UPW06906.1 hypothetical protein M1C57_23695 [Rhodococcus pyridinivorans]